MATPQNYNGLKTRTVENVDLQNGYPLAGQKRYSA